MPRRVVEVLIFEGCPNGSVALDNVRSAISHAAVDSELRVVAVQTDADARRLRFLGSPSVRIDGLDVDVTARTRNDFGLQCRIYACQGRILGAPPMQWIAEALRADDAVEEESF
jgi:hypothetical protein